MQEFSTGRVSSRATSIWLRRLPLFSMLSVVCFVPDSIFSYVVWGVRLSVSMFVLGGIDVVLRYLASRVTTATITYGVVEELRGRPATLGAGLAVGARRALPVIGASILVGLATMLGLALLVIPGIIVAIALFVVVPVVVVDRVGGARALRPSWSLTDGHRGAVFGIAVATWIVTFGASKILGTVMILDPHFGAFSEARTLAYNLAFVALAAILAPLSAAASAVAYHDLRRVEEGAEIGQIASVFE